MAKRKTTKKQVTEPVIDYVDPETNLEAEPIVAIGVDQALIRKMVEKSVDQFPDNEFFRCMKRRRDKEK